ncbi:cytochrome P450 [Nannocystaceae bacterium ST9]
MRRWHSQYGPTFTLRDLAGVSVVTSDPELIRRLFAEPQPERFDAAAPPSFDVLVGTRSLLMLPGQAHQQRRKLLGPPFCREALPSWAQAMVASTRQSFAELAPGQRFVAIERNRAITLRVIGEVIFGAVGEVGDAIHAAMIAMLDRLKSRFLVTRATQHELGGRSAFGRYMQASRELDRLLLAHIATRRREPGESLLDRMLASTDEQGQRLDDQVVVDELRTLLLGGHETTSTTLAWTLHYLHRDRAWLERVRREVDSIDDPIELARSPLLAAVIDETMRIRPVAGQLFRKLAEPMTLGPWHLPAGVTVTPAPCLVHLRPDLWPEPERFDPERFLAKPHPPAGHFIPFGGGTHRCIGAILARFEAMVILGTMLRELSFELEDASPPAWVRDGFPLGPAGGVPMRLVARRT